MTERQATHNPEPRYYLQKIGNSEYKLAEAKLDVLEAVTLWHENPRLQPFLTSGNMETDEQLEASLQRTKGYKGLASNIAAIIRTARAVHELF